MLFPNYKPLPIRNFKLCLTSGEMCFPGNAGMPVMKS